MRLLAKRLAAGSVLLAAASVGCSDGRAPASANSASPRGVSSAAGWFVDITRQVELDFVHESGATGEFYMPEVAGAGAAFLDFDGDGDLDVYLTTGNAGLPRGRRLETPTNALYRQEADGRFVDMTEQSGLGDGGYGMGIAVGDVDNDGAVDVLVTNYGPDTLYHNDGSGRFEPARMPAIVGEDHWSTSAAFLDYDRDGWLDLYIARYVIYDPQVECFDAIGRPDYCSPKAFTPIHDLLLHNTGDGSFIDVSETAGISGIAAAGLGVACDDYDGDGWIDIYVANDGAANQLWINQADGTFKDKSFVMGAAYNLHGRAEAGMGIVSEDLDGDGSIDLFISHLAVESNTFYRNMGGRGGFSDRTGATGLGPSSMPYTGFGTVALDAELDGDLDLLVVNGRVLRDDPLPGTLLSPPWDVYAEPNLFYLNDGSTRFSVVEGGPGTFSGSHEISRALAMGDIDSDGDPDLLVANIHGPARIYRNDAPRAGRWLAVRAMDPRWKRDALGARITVHAAGRSWVRSIKRAFSYLSSSEPLAHFGLGDVARVDRIEVLWPDGVTELFPGTPVDQPLVLVRGDGEIAR